MKRRAYLFAGLALIGIGGVSCGPPKGINGPRITSVAHLHDIGLAIKSYQDDHGGLPPSLSVLVPRYIPSSEISVFYVAHKSARQMIPPDWKANPGRIDEYSSYIYLGTNGMNGILAFEKTNLWKWSASQMEGKVAALYSDGRVEMVTFEKLQEFLKK